MNITFRWKFPPKSWWAATKNIFIDLSFKREKLLKELELFNKGKQTFKRISEEVDNDFGDGCHWETDTIETTYESRRSIEEQIGLLNGKNILHIKKIYPHTPCGGWGVLLSKEEFIKSIKNE